MKRADRNSQLALAAGVLGGMPIGAWAFKHMFVEGMENEQRRNMVVLGAGTGALLLLAHLFAIDFEWFTVEGAATKVLEQP